MHTSLVRGSALVALAVGAAFAVAACRRSCCGCGSTQYMGSPVVVTSAAPPAPPPPATFAEQAQRGGAIYGRACAECHGAGGEGTAGAPALVGPTALPGTPPASRQARKMAFNTVGDVQRFVKSSMPPKGPKLSDADAWAVVAFALSANGVTPASPLSGANGDTLPLGR